MEARRKALMAAPEFQLATPSNWAIDSRVQKKIPVGKTWESRSDAMELHRRSMAGIYGTKELGAISIVTSGFYPGQDDGDVLIYTGTGKGDSGTFSNGTQTQDQSFEHRDNQYLVKSMERGQPVHVIRGPNKRSAWAPARGFRYDGKYTVTNAYFEKDPKSGFQLCKFRLERLPGQPELHEKVYA